MRSWCGVVVATFPIAAWPRRLLRTTKAETERLAEAGWECRKMATLDKKGDDASQLAKNVVAIHRALEVLLAAAAPGTYSTSDHAADHLEMAIPKVPELLVDFDKRVEESERQAEQRLVAVKHNEKGSS